MNKLNKLFSEKKENILSVYFTAGFPHLPDTVPILNSLIEQGADLIEIGIPFSDPLADGPVIQHSSEVALENGMSLRLLFEQLRHFAVNHQQSNLPLILMGYLNPILQFGAENFCKKAKECGISGVILPDLPLQEYLDDYEQLFDRYGLINIFLVTPQTSAERVRLIDGYSKGFIYMVSSSSITGTKGKISTEQLAYFSRIKNSGLRNPTLIGFGISGHETFATACRYSNGAIIGSAFIKALQNSPDLSNNIREFISSVKHEKKLPKKL